MTTCPKCGYTRTEKDADHSADQCPSCGVYYEKALKVIALRAQQQADKEAELARKTKKTQDDTAKSAFSTVKAEEQHRPEPKKDQPKSRTSICDDCGGIVSLSAKKCPHCGAKMTRPVTRTQIVIVLLVAGFMLYGMFQGSKKPPVDSRPYTVQSMCEKAVSAQLKSPSSARFISDEFRFNNKNGAWTAIVTVDAQNAFGAMLRKQFTCSLVEKNGSFVFIDVKEAD